jgi:hypothetical protein
MPDALRIRRFADAAAFLERAEAWLLENEAEHNLILGIAAELRDGARRYDSPIYLATVEHGGEVVGCAFRTPPYKVGLTRMPIDAAHAVARDTADIYAAVPAVLGEESAARAFADEWRALTGAPWRVVMRNRIYQLDAVAPDLPVTPGELRVAGDDDIERIVHWVEAFSADAHLSHAGAHELARQRVAAGDFVIWEVRSQPVTMAAAVGPTPHGIRIGYVYTPPELRRRGYATACVAELSRRQISAGRRFCFLYTDLANPTSNDIYVRVGYRPIADVVDVVFDPV